jgi:hypothetical protein
MLSEKDSAREVQSPPLGGGCPKCSSSEIYVIAQCPLPNPPPPQAFVCAGCGFVELAMSPPVLATFKSKYATSALVKKLGT